MYYAAQELSHTPSHWRKLQIILQRDGIESTRITSQKNTDVFAGINISIPHINHCSAFNALLDVLTFAKNEKIPITFKPAFDTAIGTNKVREYAQGALSKQALAKTINHELQQFHNQARTCWLYKPAPHIRLMRSY